MYESSKLWKMRWDKSICFSNSYLLLKIDLQVESIRHERAQGWFTKSVKEMSLEILFKKTNKKISRSWILLDFSWQKAEK